jgi:hypothetical protein
MTKNGTYKYLYSIYDSTTQLYEPPFVDINNGSALRRIQDLMSSNPNSPYAKFPDDFDLMCIGTWSDETAHIYTDCADLVQKLNQIIPKE